LIKDLSIGKEYHYVLRTVVFS